MTVMYELFPELLEEEQLADTIVAGAPANTPIQQTTVHPAGVVCTDTRQADRRLQLLMKLGVRLQRKAIGKAVAKRNAQRAAWKECSAESAAVLLGGRRQGEVHLRAGSPA